jgi:SAM-dependent methyltransferase
MSFTEVPIDAVAGYWNRRPCNIRHSPLPPGSKEYFDQVEERKYRVEPHIPRFAEFERWRGKRVLEIGCGIGTDTINFARHGATVTAVDLSEESLAMARRRAEVFGLGDRIRFIQANAEELSAHVPIEPYDLVYSFGVIHHTPHPERAVGEAKRYLAPGGTIKIMVYYRFAWKVFWIMATYGLFRFWRWDELVARHSEAQTGCPITYTYSRRQAAELLGGLKVTGMSVEHIFPWRIEDYVQYRYRKVWYFRLLPDRLFQWLEHHFGWHLCVSAVA